jgi:hypothetical protein
MDVLFARNYARAKAAYDDAASLSADARRKLLAEPLVQLVKATEFAMVENEIEGRDG